MMGDGHAVCPLSSLDLADFLEAALSGWHVSRAELEAARHAVKVLQVRYQDGRPAGQECVFESLLRCRLTARLMSTFNVEKTMLPHLLNSSHVVSRHMCIQKPPHDHVIGNKQWAKTFTRQVRNYPKLIAIPVAGQHSPSKADLYLFAPDGIVSLELKYVGPGKLLNVVAAFRQMRLYRHHKCSILVVYAAEEVHPALDGKLVDMVGVLRSKYRQCVKALIVSGPEIARVDGTS